MGSEVKRFLVALVLAALVVASPAAQDYSVMPVPRMQFSDSAGEPVVAGKLYVYEAGTTTSVNTYSDAGVTANANPVILDAGGWAVVYLEIGEVYKFELRDEFDVTLWTQDNISPTTVGSDSATLDSLTVTGSAAGAINVQNGGIRVNGVQVVSTAGVVQIPAAIITALPVETDIDPADLVAFADEDETNDPDNALTWAEAVCSMAGQNISCDSTNAELDASATGGDVSGIDAGDCIDVQDGASTTPEVNVDVNGCTAQTAVSRDDEVPVADVDVSGDPTRKTTVGDILGEIIAG